MKRAALLPLIAAASLSAQTSGLLISYYSTTDFALTADPDSPPWKNVTGVFAETGLAGQSVAGHKTEVRSRWTEHNLCLLFLCRYVTLNLYPGAPDTTRETDKLWEWDVAEVQIGSDLQHINLYKEFQVSPRGEWVDADVDRDHWNVERQLRWTSGFKVKARIDERNKVWYGEMQIPMDKIAARAPAAGVEMRVNFLRGQGPPPRQVIAWQPTGSREWHEPKVFGRMVLK